MTKVYSTGPEGDAGSRPDESRTPPAPRTGLAPARQDVRVRVERSGRRGKTVTVAAPLVLTDDDARALLADLKRRLGTGGKLQAADEADRSSPLALEIQGDHAERVVAELAARGYPVRRSGG